MSDPRVAELLSRRPWLVRAEQLALVALPPTALAQAAQALADTGAPFAQLIAEPNMITLVLPDATWQSLRAGFPPAQVEAPFRAISFDIDLPADLVGFLAAVGRALADAGVPILAVCGYTKDHILVRERHLPAALTALDNLAGPSGATSIVPSTSTSPPAASGSRVSAG